jgi:AraC-like DNA-binding protein
MRAGWQGWASLRRNDGRRWHRHHHDELEFNLIMRGQCTYLVGDRRIILNRHDLFALFPAQEHILIEESPDATMWIMVFSPRMVAAYAKGERAWLDAADPAINSLWPLDPLRARAIDGLCQSVALAESYLTGNACLTALLMSCYEAIQVSTGTSDTAAVHPAIEQAIRRLRNDPSLNGSRLAAQCGVSRARLSRLFKQQIGIPLNRYRSSLRLQHVMDAVRDGRLNLLRAALAAGFGSYAQFHRVVRSQLGVTPRDLLADLPAHRTMPK